MCYKWLDQTRPKHLQFYFLSNFLFEFPYYQIKFIRHLETKIFNLQDQVVFKLLTKLQLRFSHLPEHKFRHNFEDIVNILCSCIIKPELTTEFLLVLPIPQYILTNLMSNSLSTDSFLRSGGDENF